MNPVFRTFLLCTGIALLWSAFPFASPAQAIERGARLRATFVDSTYGERRVLRRTGDLLDVDENSVTLQPAHGRDPLVLPRHNIQLLEESVAESRRGSHALVGLALGAAFGAAVGLNSGDDPDTGFIRLTAGQKAVIMAAVCAPLGSMIGALTAPGEQWEPVSDDRWQLGLGVGADGERVVLISLGF